MKFITVRQLAALLNLEVLRIDDELIDDLRKAVELHFLNTEELHTFDHDFTYEELIFILNSLKEEKVRVFHDWVFHDTTLSEYLISGGEIPHHSEDLVLSKEHQLFESYRIFLSTYLAPILKKKTVKSIHQEDLTSLSNHLKFSLLLPEKLRIEIQQPVSTFLRQLLGQLKVSQGADLQTQLKLVFSYEFVEVLNELDPNFYSDVIAYIDTAKLVVQKNELSPMVSDKVKSAISSVTLNKEHHKQVVEFCNSGVFDSKRKIPRSSFNNIVRSPLFFVAVIAVVINFIFFYPKEGEVVEKDSVEETTGIGGLSDEELKKADTMLGFKRDSILIEEELKPVGGSTIVIIDEDSLE